MWREKNRINFPLFCIRLIVNSNFFSVYTTNCKETFITIMYNKPLQSECYK